MHFRSLYVILAPHPHILLFGFPVDSWIGLVISLLRDSSHCGHADSAANCLSQLLANCLVSPTSTPFLARLLQAVCAQQPEPRLLSLLACLISSDVGSAVLAAQFQAVFQFSVR
jgi:hypothetical protein